MKCRRRWVVGLAACSLALAARIDQVACEIGNERDGAADARVDQPVRRRHVVGDQAMKPIHGGMADVGGLRCLSDRHAYARDTLVVAVLGSATLEMARKAGQGEPLRGFPA